MLKYWCNMAKVNLSQAAKLANKNRTTIWRHIKAGRLSSEKGVDGLPTVDTSELIRVYGDIQLNATHETPEKQHKATPSYSDLIKVIEQLRKEQLEMKEQITNLNNRLTYIPVQEPVKQEAKTRAPEDDPDWPKELKTLADISTRNEIKAKYS